MANYFIAGVGRALLFKGDTLFADCRTLTDSSISIGVTAEDVRGGEGNALFGRYFHDSSFSLKLTDAMFNLDYIAANTGAVKTSGGNTFAYETLTSNSSGAITLSATPVPVVTGGTAYVYYRKSSENGDMDKIAANGTTVEGLDASTEYCVMYRKNVDGETITINSQFIPDTLHAVLTVALYSGDSCNPESATKAGEVVIDIPRLQLSGAQEISMTATGASSTPLEGNALASGCTGCDGRSIYATITKVLSGETWLTGVKGVIIEDPGVVPANGTVHLNAYAFYTDKAPRKLADSEWTLSLIGTSSIVSVDDTAKTLTASNSGASASVSVLGVIADPTSTADGAQTIEIAAGN